MSSALRHRLARLGVVAVGAAALTAIGAGCDYNLAPMIGKRLTSLSAFAAATLGGLTLMPGAATARPTAATPQFGGAKDATAVVLDPTTGAVLAMASGSGYKVVSVTSLPDEHVLVRGKVNVVVVRPNFAFRVKVRNSHGSQQPNVSLRLSPAPLNFGPVVTKIAVERDTQTVTFTIRTRAVAFAAKEKIVITVASTSGKTLSAAYPVIFALAPIAAAQSGKLRMLAWARSQANTNVAINARDQYDVIHRFISAGNGARCAPLGRATVVHRVPEWRTFGCTTRLLTARATTSQVVIEAYFVIHSPPPGTGADFIISNISIQSCNGSVCPVRWINSH